MKYADRRVDLRGETMKFYSSCVMTGASQGRTKQELQEDWGVTDRGVRLIVAALRRKPCKDGFALCAGNSGYYWSDNPVEIRKWLKRSRAHLKRFRAELVEAERLLKRLEAGDNGKV